MAAKMHNYGDISAADHPIYSMFGSRMGFSESADRMALFPVLPKSIGVWENNARGVGWSQSKVFLVLS